MTPNYSRTGRPSGAHTAAITAGVFIASLLGTLLFTDAYEFIKGELSEEEDSLAIVLEDDPGSWEPRGYGSHESYEWIFAGPARTIQGPPPTGACSRRTGWARRQGGTDAGHTTVRLYLQAKTDRAVLLRRVSPEIRRRQPLVRGTRVACPAGGATANLRHLAVDLDAGTAEFQNGEGRPLTPTTLKFSESESEFVLVVATATRARYSWRLRLELLVEGKPVVLRVPSGGGSFSTTGVGGSKVIHWDRGAWRAGPGPVIAGLGPG